MLRCLRPGCPTACGTRHTPSCVDRTLRRGLLALLTAAILISLAAGLLSLRMAEDHSRQVPESMRIEPAESVRHTGVKASGRAAGETDYKAVPLP